MSEVKRTIHYYPDSIGIEHDEGRSDNYGRTVLDVAGNKDDLAIWLYENKGYDRDNYQDSWEVEMSLNEDEARELLLFLTVWLEDR